jgi:ribosomal protein L40E
MKASRVAQTIKPKVEPKGKIMWICLKCNNYNSDEMRSCLRCGFMQGYADAPTSLTNDDIIPEPREPNFFDKLPKPVGMTRRFSVGTMMILMTFYAVLFSAMTLLGAGPPVFAGITVFFTGIGLAQMFAPAHVSPRKVSFISGIVMGFISSIVAAILSGLLVGDHDMRDDGTTAFCFLFAIMGGPFGYLAGGLIAGIFLFREREEQAAVEAEENESK